MRLAIQRLLPVALILALGCTRGRDHVIPDAMVIRDGATVVAHARGTRVESAIVIPAGGATRPLTVRFLDRDGREIDDTDYVLEVIAVDPGMAQWQHDEPGGFTGSLEGGAPGTAVLMFQWMHLWPRRHKDRDWPVEVTVSP
jgi:hypothetical protein